MRFRTWIVAAFGLGSLLLLIVVSTLTLSRKAQAIYAELDQLNTHHQEVDTKLRRLRSDVNLSGIFVRDYLLDISREHAQDYRDRLAEFRRSNKANAAELLVLDPPHANQIRDLENELDDYWETFEPLFDWTTTEKMFRSASFLRREVIPRREAILAIAQEIEHLNNANLDAQRAAVSRRQHLFAADLRLLLWQTIVLGAAVALMFVFRLRLLEQRSEHQRAIAEDAERQVRQLAQERDAAQEDERKRLSRELHDHVAQMLTALRMELGRIERTRSTGDTRIGAAVAECKKLVDSMFRIVRDLALGLRPSMLDDFGLQAALEWHIRDAIGRWGMDVELVMKGNFDALADRQRTCVYRAIQEALTNCARHAQARHVRVAVQCFDDHLDVLVTDDGNGFDLTREHKGLGLHGIEERVRELHGVVSLVSAPGSGTSIHITLPLAANASELSLARAAG